LKQGSSKYKIVLTFSCGDLAIKRKRNS